MFVCCLFVSLYGWYVCSHVHGSFKSPLHSHICSTRHPLLSNTYVMFSKHLCYRLVYISRKNQYFYLSLVVKAPVFNLRIIITSTASWCLIYPKVMYLFIIRSSEVKQRRRTSCVNKGKGRLVGRPQIADVPKQFVMSTLE